MEVKHITPTTTTINSVGSIKTAGLILFFLFTFPLQPKAQNLGTGLRLEAELGGTASSGSMAPLWLSANRYGTVSPYDNSAYERAGIFRPLQTKHSGKSLTLESTARAQIPTPPLPTSEEVPDRSEPHL